MDTIHWIVFMVAGFCFFWVFFSFMDTRKKIREKIMIRIYIWILLLLAIAFIKYEWFKQFFTDPLTGV